MLFQILSNAFERSKWMYNLYNDDCFNIFPKIADKSVDLILCDLPYGTTHNEWDKTIPYDKLWEQYNRIIKDRGVIALFSSAPFDKILACSNLKDFRYEWVWKKNNTVGFLNSNNAPLRQHEVILIFSHKGFTSANKQDNMIYNPQMRKGKPYVAKSGAATGSYNKYNSVTTVTDERYPTDILEFALDYPSVHPTQKPVELCEYLIKTYTDKGMLVLDNCMGSGSVGVACKHLNRDFIGIELNKEYFDIAERRINESDELLDFSGLL